MYVHVDLQPGQTLFYESAKCIHGRPTPMKGRYYTSVFLHYRPTDWATRMDDARTWRKGPWVVMVVVVGGREGVQNQVKH